MINSKINQNTKKCIQCNIEFKASISSKRKFCTNKCANIYNNTLRKTGHYINCLNCSKELYVQPYTLLHDISRQRKYCSDTCKNEWNHKSTQVIINCSICNSEIHTTKCSSKKRKFCSIKCSNIYRSQLARKSNKVTKTKPEIVFENLLKTNNISYISQKWLPWKKGWKKFYDFYIPKYNLLIEIDGVYWHGKGIDDISKLNYQQMRTYKNDIVKNELARQSGYELIRIWEDEIDKFDFSKLTNTINYE